MGRLALTRGDVVVMADGKPRPAAIVQADAFPTPTNILVCPLTSDLADAHLYRIEVKPSPGNGLRTASQLMMDRMGPVRRDRIDAVIGRLDTTDLVRLGDALALVLDLSR